MKVKREYKTPYESFIGGWYIPKSICNNLIKLFNKNKQLGKTHEGLFLRDSKKIVLKKIKDSEDLCLYPSDDRLEVYNYRKHLQSCLNNYINKYPDADKMSKYNVTQNYNIQHYNPGGGYKNWHSERGLIINSTRVLVFMTYLNDVEDGGTDFKYQKLTSPAQQGLTLIWPSEWTHTHRSQVSLTKNKYIVTGWFNFIDENK